MKYWLWFVLVSILWFLASVKVCDIRTKALQVTDETTNSTAKNSQYSGIAEVLRKVRPFPTCKEMVEIATVMSTLGARYDR